jgi:ABC-type lipoprotein release transport system permease subunit
MLSVMNSIVLVVIVIIVVLVIWLVFRQKQYKVTFKSQPKSQIITKKEVPLPKDKSFIFDITVVDPETFVSRQLKAKLLLTNAQLFIKPTSIGTQPNFISPPDEELIRKNVKLQFLGMQQDVLDFNVNSKDELPEHYYEIKNKYFLMDPFLTSGKDMIITEQMKNHFQNVLNIKVGDR